MRPNAHLFVCIFGGDVSLGILLQPTETHLEHVCLKLNLL